MSTTLEQAADTASDVHGHAGHSHGVSADADRRWLSLALVLITGFIVVEVILGVLAGSLALISDAGHMLTDAASIVLALVALRLAARPARGEYTYGLQRAEILSAQINGISLLLLAAYFGFEAIRRLWEPATVAGPVVVAIALIGIVINLATTWCLSRANRSSLNIEGAYRHIRTDLVAFIATAVAGAVVWAFGFDRADAVAALVVALFMVKAGWGLVSAAGRIFLEAAPKGIDPADVRAGIAAVGHVIAVNDLHIWQITSGRTALSAHVLVARGADCHAVREHIEALLHGRHGIRHTTLQVDHVPGYAEVGWGVPIPALSDQWCSMRQSEPGNTNDS